MKKVLRFIFSFILLISIMLTAIIAFAADPPAGAPNASVAVADVLRQSVLPVIGSFILGLLSWVLAKLGEKFKIDALRQKNNFVMQIAGQGVAYAEEKAASLVGSKSELTGSEKLDQAIAFICQAIPKLTPEQADAAAHAALAMIPGVGATADAVVAYPAAPAAPAVPAPAS
jgi:hypothetical protein